MSNKAGWALLLKHFPRNWIRTLTLLCLSIAPIRIVLGSYTDAVIALHHVIRLALDWVIIRNVKWLAVWQVGPVGQYSSTILARSLWMKREGARILLLLLVLVALLDKPIRLKLLQSSQRLEFQTIESTCVNLFVWVCRPWAGYWRILNVTFLLIDVAFLHWITIVSFPRIEKSRLVIIAVGGWLHVWLGVRLGALL